MVKCRGKGIWLTEIGVKRLCLELIFKPERKTLLNSKSTEID